MNLRDSSRGLEKARAGVASGGTLWRRVALLGTINLALLWGCASVGGGGAVSQGGSSPLMQASLACWLSAGTQRTRRSSREFGSTSRPSSGVSWKVSKLEGRTAGTVC